MTHDVGNISYFWNLIHLAGPVDDHRSHKKESLKGTYANVQWFVNWLIRSEQEGKISRSFFSEVFVLVASKWQKEKKLERGSFLTHCLRLLLTSEQHFTVGDNKILSINMPRLMPFIIARKPSAWWFSEIKNGITLGY